MTLPVHAPFGGVVVAMADLPDPVFAQEIVGPGLGIEPTGDDDVDVVAPVDGTLVKVHPHAFVVLTAEGTGVLVHLGLDTVELQGEGFTVHVTQGQAVRVGQRLVTWNPAAVAAGGRAPVSPVVAREAEPGSLTLLTAPGEQIVPGTPLFTTP